MKNGEDRPVFVSDPDVLAALGFMQSQIAAGRLVGVSKAIATLAPLLWGKYQPDEVQVIRLDFGPIVESRRPVASIE